MSESFGFNGELGKATGGKAFPQMSFDHWSVFGGDPLDPGSKAFAAISGTRVRKGLAEEMPPLDRFLDKL